MSSGGLVSAQIVVRAPARRVFDLLSDPARHPVLDGSGSVRSLLRGPERLSLGARFAVSMHLGLPYAVVNRVVEFEEGRRIAWSHVGGSIWRYELEPLDPTSTQVTGSVDVRSSPLPSFYTMLLRRKEQAVVRNLALLADVARTGG